MSIHKIPAILSVLLTTLTMPLAAQSPQSLLQLSDSLMENNYSIRLLRIEEDLSRIQNGTGASGELPRLGLAGTVQQSTNNTRQQFFNGDVREATGAANQSTALGVRLDWSVFQGFYVWSNREQLRLLEEQAVLNTYIGVETQSYQLARLYYEVIVRQQLLKALDSTLALSRLRHELAATRLNIGAGNRLEYVQSLLDLNADSALWLRERSLIETRLIELKNVCGIPAGSKIALPDTFGLGDLWIYQDLLEQAQRENSEISALRLNQRIAGAEIRRQKSALYPQLGVFAEYNFLSSTNEVGILQSNRTLGPAAGVSLQYPLFDGLRVRREIAAAKAGQQYAETALEARNYSLEMDLLRAYENYLLHRQLAEIEMQNIAYSREHRNLARIQYESGRIDAFQFREIQLVSINAEARFAEAMLNAKWAELELKLLSGGLIKEVRKN